MYSALPELIPEKFACRTRGVLMILSNQDGSQVYNVDKVLRSARFVNPLKRKFRTFGKWMFDLWQ